MVLDICPTCGKPVETDSDMNYEGAHAVKEPLDDVSFKCESCGDYAHIGCAWGSDSKLCLPCGEWEP